MSANPMADFLDFMKTAEVRPTPDVALAYFVGYSTGSMSSRQTADALVEAFKASQPKPDGTAS